LKALHLSEANGVPVSLERGTRSARASVDRDAGLSYSAKAHAADSTYEPATSPETKPADGETSRVKVEAADDTASSSKLKRPITVRTSAARISLPARQPLPAANEQLSESDDEDMDVYFDSEMAKAEAELKKLESAGGNVPTGVVARYAALSFEAMARVATETDGLTDMVGPIPESFKFVPSKTAEAKEPESAEAMDVEEAEAPTGPASESTALPTIEPTTDSSIQLEPKPKVEDTDMAGSGLPPIIIAPDHSGPVDVDMEINNTTETEGVPGSEAALLSANGVSVDATKLLTFPTDLERSASRKTSPSQVEEDDETEEEEIDYATVETVREYMTTPPLEDLPDYTLKPWYQSKKVRNVYSTTSDLASYILTRMKEEMSLRIAEQQDVKRDYRERYDSYLRFTLSDDPTASKSRSHFASSNVPIITPSGKPPPIPEAKPEGRRTTSRNATELDIEYVMQQSIREHQEAQGREARAQKEKYRSDKEASIPTMYWTQEERDREAYLDNSGLLPVEKLVATWQVLPPVVNFTEEEAEQFEKAYLEFPKQWGNIAKHVPNRDFKACIQYYYAKKNELNLKDKLKKQPRKRKKGRGKQRSSALVSELGNTENDGEEGQENGENGERRRPRRAAAPTWGYEATPTADSDGTQSNSTPGGRRGAASKNADGTDKPEAKKGRRSRAAKEKEAKAAKPAQTLAPTPPTSKASRSRSNSRAQGPEWVAPPPPPQPPQPPVSDAGRLPTQFEMSPRAMQAPAPPVQQPPIASPERAPLPLSSSISENVMAPPSLRPEPLNLTGTVAQNELGYAAVQERMRANPPQQQASSYWSVAETTDFPALLRAFGTDWVSIAAYMQSKTAIMVGHRIPLCSLISAHH